MMASVVNGCDLRLLRVANSGSVLVAPPEIVGKKSASVSSGERRPPRRLEMPFWLPVRGEFRNRTVQAIATQLNVGACVVTLFVFHYAPRRFDVLAAGLVL